MARISRWEKERSAWLLAHSKPGSSLRRRSELLARTARKSSRGGLGVADSAFHDDPTSPLLVRLLKTDDGTGEKVARLVLVPAAFIVIALMVWPAVALVALIYSALWLKSPQIGRLWWWPWIVAGGAIGVVGAVIWAMLGAPAPLGASPWPPALLIYTQPFAWFVAWSQLALGLVLTGAQIYYSGWSGVPAGAVLKAETDKDGNYLATPDHLKVQLDPLASQGAEPAGASEVRQPAGREPVASAGEADDDEAPVFAEYTDPFDDEAPVFADDINDLKENKL